MSIFAIPLVVLSDQLSKYLVKKNVSEGATKTLIVDALYIRRVRNYGFANNLMDKSPQFVRGLSGLVILSGFGYLPFLVKNCSKAVVLGFSLMLGGGVSNFVDRLTDGFVTDFICFKKGKAIVYNIADFCIFCGSLIVILSVLFGKNEKF